MPKVVDHVQRRQELVESTWRVIARLGLAGATMRQIAEEAGYANGALKPYFPTKMDLLEATFEHVYSSTEERIGKSIEGLRGFEAVRAMCLEVLPFTERLRDEARIVVSFWDSAAQDGKRAALAAVSTNRWCEMIATMLKEAKEDGLLRSISNVESTAEILVVFLQGSQITAVMDPEGFSKQRIINQLEAYLDLLRV
ncbi:MAG: TetR/AcrR family transcriptional regulator [Corynebacterium casei]|uniref:TetR/AcrR family transcriptional regulator n=1 Tax=Corynebacterium casei TaxID=160386 RepID=UPI003F93E6D7